MHGDQIIGPGNNWTPGNVPTPEPSQEDMEKLKKKVKKVLDKPIKKVQKKPTKVNNTNIAGKGFGSSEWWNNNPFWNLKTVVERLLQEKYITQAQATPVLEALDREERIPVPDFPFQKIKDLM